ncbi:MAG: PKD domain-containing protein [Candidatus Acidiferrales bacterium]
MRSLRLNIAKALLLLSGIFLFAGNSAQAQQFTVGNYQQISQRRVSLYVYEYVYQAYVSNSGGPATNVVATVTSTSSHTTIIDDSLSFGDVAADTSTLSLNTFRFQQDRRFAFSFSNLVWTISSASAQPPIANAGPAQTVPVGTTVTLNGSGSSDPNGSGITKILWTFDSIPTGSAATLANATTFSPSFVVDEAGQYIARLTITDGLGLTGTSAVTISTVSSPPVADAGISETFPVGTTVTLDGSGSTDVDGAPLTFSWSFVSVPVGSAATLSNPAAVKPTFVLDKLGNYVVQLIVTAEGLTSAPSQVTISTTDVPPLANAGLGQTVQVGAMVTLNGSGSSDLAGNPITFSWSFVSIPLGSVAVLTNPTAIHPTFVADRVGAYSVQLVVSDGTLSSTPSTVTINSDDVAPVAIAGPAQTVFVATAVTLDGSASTDSDSMPLTYSWALTVVPAGSAAKLANPISVHPSFTVDVDGTYVAQLIVNDGILSSSPSTVTISTQPSTPTANAGGAQAVSVGATVQLDGSGSSDPDNSPLTYSWLLLSKPAGSKAVLSSASNVNPTFVADVAGAYLVQLTVTSNGLTSAPSNVTITAATGAAAILVFTTQPANGTAGTPLAQVVVEVQDGSGNVVTSSNAAITISSTSAGVSGTITVSAVNGVATFSALQFAATGTYTLTAASPGLTSATSNSFSVSAGTATKLVFTTQPTNVGAGAAITPAVQVTIEDGSGNTVTSATNSVTIAIGNNPAGGTLAGALTVNAVNGVATFSNLNINHAGTGYTLAATAAGLAAATSSAFNVTAGTATKLVFTVQPSNVGAGAAITPAVQVTIEDGSGNTVTSATNSVSIAISNNPASGTLAGTLAVSAVNGVATFTNLSINNAGTGYTLAASAAGLAAATSSAFNVTSVNTLLVTTSGGALGVGRNFGATVTLSAPAPLGGVTVTLASANPGVVTVAPASLLVPAGGTTASFTLTGVAAGGPITLTATATGYTSGTAQVTVTGSLISLATGLVVAPAQSSSLAFSLSSPAPAGGVTVNFVSSSTAVATITSSVIVPAGATVASSNPQVTGVTIGTVQITATATGFAQDTESVQITVTASTSPTSLTLNATRTTNIQLNISAPAPAGGITFNLLSNNTAAATVPASVTVPAGGLSAQIPVTGVAAGSAMLTITSAGINTVTVSITVSAAPALTPNFAATLGMNLQTDNGSVSLGANPPSSETLTIASSSPNLLLATSPAGSFSQTITSTINTNGTGASGFSMQALAGSGTATITASAPGYATGTITVTLVPSGVLWENGSFSTTTFSANTTLTLAMVQLNPTTLANAGVQELRTGAAPVTVTLGSSNTTVGTLPSSVTFTADVSSVTASFQPLTAGTTNLTITTPSGFSTPTPTTATQITATVTAPQLTPNFAATLGMSLQTDNGSVSLGANPPSSEMMTITSSSPSLLLATSPAGPFSQTITSTINSNGTGASGFSMQALAGSGSVQIKAQAAGYTDGVITVTLVPSGLIWENGSFSTTPTASPTTLTLAMVQLNPTTLANAGVQELRTGATPVTVTLGSSNTTVGTIPSPVTFTARSFSVTASFQPLTAGTTNLTITTPSGFSTPTPTTATQITATVN